MGSQGVPFRVLKTRRLWVDAEPLGPRTKRFRPCSQVLSGRSIWEQQGRRTPRPSRRVGSPFDHAAGAPGPVPLCSQLARPTPSPLCGASGTPEGRPASGEGGPQQMAALLARRGWPPRVTWPLPLSASSTGGRLAWRVLSPRHLPHQRGGSAREVSKSRAGLSVTSPFKVSF